MKTDVHCVSSAETAAAAARRMREGNVEFMPVCDKRGKVVGMLTDRDIAIRLVAEGLPLGTQVKDIMSRDIVCCGAQDEIGRAQKLMARHRKSRIMCVDEAGRLEGVISLGDISHLKNLVSSRTRDRVSKRTAQV